MAQQYNSRALDMVVDSQTQQGARPRRVPSRRRRRRRAAREAPESQVVEEPRKLQVYKFSRRPPPVSAPNNGESPSGEPQISELPDDGTALGMMARSASYWERREPSRCWVRGCSCGGSGKGDAHPTKKRVLTLHFLDEEDLNSAYLVSEEFVTRENEEEDDDDDVGSIEDTATASSWDYARSDDGPRSWAEEFSLVPLSRRKQYSAQTFHDAVERFLSGF